MNIKTKCNRGFTLVELLVVIAIIAILAALATPAILKAKTKAKIVKVRAICKAFEVGVNAFENEYNYLPYGGASYPTDEEELGKSDNDGLVAVLAGAETNLNSQGNKYFELGEPTGSSDDNYIDGMHLDKASGKAALYDPWGNRYHIKLDYVQGTDNEDGIEHPYDSSEDIRKKVVIYSDGPDKVTNTTKIRHEDNKDNASNF